MSMFHLFADITVTHRSDSAQEMIDEFMSNPLLPYAIILIILLIVYLMWKLISRLSRGNSDSNINDETAIGEKSPASQHTSGDE